MSRHRIPFLATAALGACAVLAACAPVAEAPTPTTTVIPTPAPTPTPTPTPEDTAPVAPGGTPQAITIGLGAPSGQWHSWARPR